jgi:hypothetical protein
MTAAGSTRRLVVRRTKHCDYALDHDHSLRHGGWSHQRPGPVNFAQVGDLIRPPARRRTGAVDRSRTGAARPDRRRRVFAPAVGPLPARSSPPTVLWESCMLPAVDPLQAPVQPFVLAGCRAGQLRRPLTRRAQPT